MAISTGLQGQPQQRAGNRPAGLGGCHQAAAKVDNRPRHRVAKRPHRQDNPLDRRHAVLAGAVLGPKLDIDRQASPGMGGQIGAVPTGEAAVVIARQGPGDLQRWRRFGDPVAAIEAGAYGGDAVIVAGPVGQRHVMAGGRPRRRRGNHGRRRVGPQGEPPFSQQSPAIGQLIAATVAKRRAQLVAVRASRFQGGRPTLRGDQRRRVSGAGDFNQQATAGGHHTHGGVDGFLRAIGAAQHHWPQPGVGGWIDPAIDAR